MEHHAALHVTAQLLVKLTGVNCHTSVWLPVPWISTRCRISPYPTTFSTP